MSFYEESCGVDIDELVFERAAFSGSYQGTYTLFPMAN